MKTLAPQEEGACVEKEMSGQQPLPSCRTGTLNPPCLTSRRSQPPLALSVPLSRFASQVGGGSAFYVRRLSGVHIMNDQTISDTKRSGLAVWSLVLGILGILLGMYLGFVAAIAAVICGHKALSRLKKD